ncbi:MAG: hypothetical protein FD123_2359 [Bacteroidetes bacterium]|nr:MAG: hypothetical protein FD123_2359 [Bacteroidota bacterium]
MSKQIFFVFFIAMISACSGDKTGENTDSAATETSHGIPQATIGESLVLEDLCTIKSEAELIEKYGKENVTRDTIPAGEGTFYIGTKLFPGTNKQVELSWSDTVKFEKLLSAMIRTGYDSLHKPFVNNQWKSKTGIRLGTTLLELEQLNGKPFIIFGFGWDYGGMLQSWDKGKLENAQVFVSLEKPEAWDYKGELGKLYEKFQGDSQFKTDNADLHKLNPVVMEITVSPGK